MTCAWNFGKRAIGDECLEVGLTQGTGLLTARRLMASADSF